MRIFFQAARAIGLTVCLAAGTSAAISQTRNDDAANWPRRVVKLVVPTAPGQASDVLARLLADYLSKAFGQPFIVDNRNGGGGFIGLSIAAKSPPDGYTLVIASSGPLTVSPAVLSKVPMDTVKDLEPIANIALTPQVILVASKGPYKSLSDLIGAAKKKDLAFAIPPLGSTSHLAYAAFARSTNTNFTLVPFKGNVDSATQVIGGDVAAMYDTVPGALNLLKAGKLRPLAVAASQRSPFLPDTPTLGELGIQNSEAVGWIGLAAPVKTPPEILEKLASQVQRFLADPAVRASMKAQGFAPVDSATRESFKTTIRSDLAHWSKVAKEANIHVD
ncbi:Bug family tripartite tricarboxylate transporter substrate binding protein [Cupriavidus oxalaticus]|nr:tripartite tricarboxylate transporter substrate binding protein [Cupriavidus oxalaticus]